MKSRILCSIVCLCFCQVAIANLNGDWAGQEFAKTTIRAQGFSVSSFSIASAQLTVDTSNRTMSFVDDLGAKDGLFSQRIRTKWDVVQQHTYSCRFEKLPLQTWFYSELSNQLGSDYLISNLTISSASASGEELNEADENLGETEHAMHGIYKIRVNFKVAEALYPTRKVAFSLGFDVDFALLRPVNIQTPLPIISSSAVPPPMQNAAQLIKQILSKISAAKN